MLEETKEVKTYNVYAKCNEIINGNTCTGTYIPATNHIEWNNNGTTGDLSDDTFTYNYICDVCSSLLNSGVKYPHQKFIEI